MISRQQRTARRGYIGSSDAPAILGWCPWKTPHAVWRSKVFGDRQEYHDGVPGGAAQEGIFLEPALLDFAASRVGRPFERDRMLVSLEDPAFAANFDGLGDNFVVEAKLVHCNSPERDDWGRGGSCHVPMRVAVQVQHQLFVAGPRYQVAYVVVLRGWEGRMLGVYPVRRDERMIREQVAYCRSWWERYVIGNTPPPLVGRDLSDRAARHYDGVRVEDLLRDPQDVPEDFASAEPTEAVAHGR
jgi:putative phage-type endonuclease